MIESVANYVVGQRRHRLLWTSDKHRTFPREFNIGGRQLNLDAAITFGSAACRRGSAVAALPPTRRGMVPTLWLTAAEARADRVDGF